MTTPVAFAAGSRLTAALENQIQPLQVIKPANQSVTSSVTLVNDSALSASLPFANATYTFSAIFLYSGGTGGSSDLKLQWNVPAGTTMQYCIEGIGSGGGSLVGNGFSAGTTQSLRTGGAGVLQTALFYGTVIMGATTGTLQLQWAQNTSSATATIMQSGSAVTLMRVS